MASLKGKTLFISGGSRGIGLAIALRAARDGANVALAAKTAEPHPRLKGTVYTAADEVRAAVDELSTAIQGLERVNSQESHEPHEDDVLDHAKYMRDSVLPAMAEVRTASDHLERIVADDLWPLPRYSEMLFIK